MKMAGSVGSKHKHMTTNDNEIFAFVLMPFDSEFSDVYRLGIKETASQLGILAERVDEQIFREGILDRIYRQIEVADLIIADMSGQNPNVFYEVGYAHAKGKLCVLMTKNATDIPFDLKHHRHIVYGESISKLRDQLLEELAWAKNEISNVRTSRIKVILKSASGNLESTKYLAKGTVDIKIDLLNESSSPSAEIEAIYFYSSGGWTLYEGNRECPSTDSDLRGFKTRHFLTLPVRRLHKNSWAQLNFETRKILAFAKEGDQLKDSYRVSGRSVVRLVTSDGNFDYEIPLDVTFEDIAF